MSITQKGDKYVVSVYNSKEKKQDHVGTFADWDKAAKAHSAAKAEKKGRPKPSPDFSPEAQELLSRKWELVDV